VLALAAPTLAESHPLGNFSISHYAGLRIESRSVELRYFVDMAEIPTFQEVQDTGIVPEAGHPSLMGYLARKAEALNEGLRLEVNGRRLRLAREWSDVLFSPGAGGLPTMKIGVLYRAPLEAVMGPGRHMLRYHDGNFPDRAGWKEIVAVGGPGIVVEGRSVPDRDRSRELSDYPTDLLNSPPQDLEAHLIFTAEAPPPAVARLDGTPGARLPESRQPVETAPPRSPMTGSTGRESALSARPLDEAPGAGRQGVSEGRIEAPPAAGSPPLRLEANRQTTPRNAFTELLTTGPVSVGVIALALVVAVVLGAFHALEPGHGKTVVAAYLVGSRGTARHAMVLGLVVTASHTAGVYLLGAVTLYASRYIVPERLYPWLGVLSGLTIAGLGFLLFLRRYAGTHPHDHAHPHAHAASHQPEGVGHSHAHVPTGGGDPVDSAHRHPHLRAHGSVSLRELLALGITGGIVPCPAALVVLLSALALRRVGFGLLLIVAFSVGLASVLIVIGLLMVYARRAMSRFHGEGPLITRWLPLTSSAVMTVLGLGIAVQALVTAGIVQIRL
jgi:ABC-type nickel/cobalt efflux system permease component RcnA